MTYSLDIELNDPLEAALDDILSEVEEAIENIRKYKPERISHPVDVDIGELLSENQAIGIVWDIQHVKDQRPDLTDKQAWEVLQECQCCWDRLSDPMLEMFRQVAENLHPRNRIAQPTKVARIIADYDPNGDERENLVDLLTDTLHWCEAFGEPFDEFYGTAKMHFAEEVSTYKKGA